MEINKRDEIRYNLLLGVYNYSKADSRVIIDFEELSKELEIDYNEMSKAYHFLCDEGFLEGRGMGYTLSISHYGIKSVESILRKVDFDESRSFTTTELFQLKVILEDIKQELIKLGYGQEVIFNEIDEALDKSKSFNKDSWKKYLIDKTKDWIAGELISKAGGLVIEGCLEGLKIKVQ